MKRKLFSGRSLFLCLALTSIIITPGLYAGGYEFGGLGSRALAMGGAYIGLADDWTASYWNPAGLSQLEGSGVGANFLSPHPSAYSKSLPGIAP
ncbi:MAG: hypothetical protein U9N73_06025 [Candidatus Auribacterota bacterium]|nr:hypothetical protein [Candidatus Auribacterota bacterium]